MEELYEIAFGVIMHAGDSKSYSMEAVTCAEKGDFEGAEEKLKLADQELRAAHETQTDLLQQEALGKKTELSLLMVHAQDHYSMAQSQRDVSGQLIRLYRRLK